MTLLVLILIPPRFTGALRLWAPAIGIVTGGLTAGLGFGIYDLATVREAAWIGLPDLAHPGVDLSFRPEFWALLPSFIMVTLVGAMDTLGDSIAIQRVSWRRPRAIDFRSIQGAISADGVGNLLSGLAGTVPNTTYGMSINVAELTGVASRAIGIAVGATSSTRSPSDSFATPCGSPGSDHATPPGPSVTCRSPTVNRPSPSIT